MNDQDLRALVRELVARRLAERATPPRHPEHQTPGTAVHVGPSGVRAHPSHDVYLTIVNAGDTCVIEPGVSCHHCDYCKSHGH